MGRAQTGAAILLAAAVSAAATAEAAEVTDGVLRAGKDFEMRLAPPGWKVCLLLPAGDDGPGCEGLSPEGRAKLADSTARASDWVHAMLRSSDTTVVVSAAPLIGGGDATREQFEVRARGWRKGILKEIPDAELPVDTPGALYDALNFGGVPATLMRAEWTAARDGGAVAHAIWHYDVYGETRASVTFTLGHGAHSGLMVAATAAVESATVRPASGTDGHLGAPKDARAGADAAKQVFEVGKLAVFAVVLAGAIGGYARSRSKKRGRG